MLGKHHRSELCGPRLFLDTGDILMVRKYAGLVDGVTTTPTILRRDGAAPDQFAKEVRSEFPDIELHIEALGDDGESTMRRIDELCERTWFSADRVVFKVPLTAHGLRAVDRLRREAPQIRINLHMIFSRPQALFALRATPAYIAPLVGRYADWLARRPEPDDTPFALLSDIMTAKRQLSVGSLVLASSIRNPHHFVQCAGLGVDAVTLPPGVLAQCLEHELTDESIRQFHQDER